MRDTLLKGTQKKSRGFLSEREIAFHEGIDHCFEVIFIQLPVGGLLNLSFIFENTDTLAFGIAEGQIGGNSHREGRRLILLLNHSSSTPLSPFPVTP